MPTSPIPLYTSVSDCYSNPSLIDAQSIRWKSLSDHFSHLYPNHPLGFIARAPGRVNIIGEHIDYCGFSVLPAAVERDTLIAFSISHSTEPIDPTLAGKETTFHLQNSDPKYTSVTFSVDLSSDGSALSMPFPHHWSSYFIAGTKGILSHLDLKPPSASSRHFRQNVPKDVYCLITGSVPQGSGLSSSSAMTTAAAIAVLQVCERRIGDCEVNRRELTQIAIESERLVGVNSGGMDQAASVFSQPSNLLHIEFDPILTAKPIPLPPAITFVIANSLVTSDKQVTAKTRYNLRVTETRLGALLLAHHLNLPSRPSTSSPLTYSNVLTAYFTSSPPLHGPAHHAPQHRIPSSSPPSHPPPLPTSPPHSHSPLLPRSTKKIQELKLMLGVCGTALGGPGREKGETWDEVAMRLGRDREELEKTVCGGLEVEPDEGRLKVWKRGRHVFTEALRVYQFCNLLKSAVPSSPLPSPVITPSTPEGGSRGSEIGGLTQEEFTKLLTSLGHLMNESQDSCRNDYECSCVEIDELVELAKENGSLGSRLTGAGWGGATVHLVPEEKVKDFIKALREGYYNKRFLNLTEEELNDVCFSTKPEAGACLFQAPPTISSS